MPLDDDWLYSRSGPRTARGGIKSQSNRGSFGKNWWARRWLKVLERFDVGTRLQRARSYARKGQVLSIEVQEGLVKSTVQGSRKIPYDVEIRVKTIPDEKWFELSKEAFNQAIVAAKLLAGEMPEDVEMLFTAHDVSLFPTEKGDLETNCSCPDWSNPCKHIAAVYYLLGEEFDRDPFLIFRLRGMTKEKLLELVAGTPTTKSKRSLNETSPTDLATEPLPADMNSFWSIVVAAEDVVGAVKAPTTNASLPKRLGNLPFWRGKQSMIPLFEEIYKRASDESISILADENL